MQNISSGVKIYIPIAHNRDGSTITGRVRAEYILNEGNMNVLLCERGIRTFETATRYTLDLNAVPILKAKTHLPVVVDPTHGVGLREFIPQMSIAAVAAGADAIMLEVHHSPDLAKSDGEQALVPEMLAKLVPRLRAVANAVVGAGACAAAGIAKPDAAIVKSNAARPNMLLSLLMG